MSSDNAVSFRRDSDLLFDPEGFAHGQRVAKMFAESQLIPPHLRGKIADVTIALMMAKRLGEDPLVVMQSIYIVSGRAGWSAQYMIARANRSGIFRGRINWRLEGKPDDLVVTAFARLADTDEEVAIAASMAMARAEGWTRNEKYKSMPEIMLRYRSATLLIRMYAPDVMLGLPVDVEIETIPVEPGVDVIAQRRGRAALGLPQHEPPAEPVEAAGVAGVDAEEAARIQAQESAQAEAEQASQRRPRGFEEKMRGLGWPDDVVTAMAPVTVRVCVEQRRAFGEWRLTDDGTVVRRNGGA